MSVTREEVRAWLERRIQTAKDIAEAGSDDPQFSRGFMSRAVEFHRAALDALEDAERYKSAIEWALGRGDSDFGDALGDRAPGDGKKPRIGRYWWRAELARRAGLNGEEADRG